MQRLPFVLLCKPGQKTSGINTLFGKQACIRKKLKDIEADNVSVWGIQDFLFCYGEYPDDVSPLQVTQAVYCDDLFPFFDLFAAPGTLPLMYHDIGIVRKDKSQIRHRVFATRLKDGCADEYKCRHDALVEARGDKISEGPNSNFTIWNANGYIFGYCERVKFFDHDMTEEEKASTIAWEIRQLEIMDWLTDDVDWITGEKHDSIKLIFAQ